MAVTFLTNDDKTELSNSIAQVSSEINIKIEEALTEAKENGELNGEDGYTPVKGQDYWTEADKSEIVAETTEDLKSNYGFITKAVNDLENYYLKSQTYSSEEVDQRISLIPKFSISVVTSLPSGDISETTIYLVGGGESGNLYTEYIRVNGAWEILGSQRVDLTGYATETWVSGQLSGYQQKGDYALKSELPSVPTKLSELGEDSTHRVVTDAEKSAWNAKSEFSGNYNDLTNKPVIPTVPVQSVNGKTGVVNLSATDVKARPDTWLPTLTDIGAAPAGNYLTSETDPTVPTWAKTANKPTYTKSEVGLANVDNVKQYSASNPPPYPVTSVNGKTGAVTLSASDVGARANTWTPTAAQVGADPSGTATSAINTHNQSTTAHADIRNQIDQLYDAIDEIGTQSEIVQAVIAALPVYNGEVV